MNSGSIPHNLHTQLDLGLVLWHAYIPALFTFSLLSLLETRCISLSCWGDNWGVVRGGAGPVTAQYFLPCFMCLTHSEAKQTEMLEFGAEQGWLQSHARRWVACAALKPTFFGKIFFFPLFRAAPSAYGSSQDRGRNGATADGLHCSHAMLDGSLNHWARSGIKPASSWILVGFVSAEPQWELLVKHL